MTFRNEIITLATLAALTPALSLANATNLGPLMTYSQSPLQSNSLSPQLRSGFSLAHQTKEFYISATSSSVWAENEVYHADYYQNSVLMGTKWQFTEKWQANIQYRWNFSANNHLDNVTDKFHTLFGFDANGRDKIKHNQNNIIIPEYGIKVTDFEGETLSSAFSFYTQYQLIQTPHHGLSVGGSLYYNHVGSGPFKDSRFEQGLQLNYSYQNRSHHIYTSLGVSYRHNEEVFAQLPYRNTTFAMLFGYQYDLDDNQELMFEHHWYEGSASNIADISDPSNEIVLGYRYNWQKTSLEFVILENIFNMDNSADISFTLSLRHRIK
ncbi:DUF3187 family protein [Shewanella marisflavi]|uniref:DUF3187 family protein n=1 Tax=Shewanella marisflavi TaxID=260364 RepID=A0AAC9U0Q6_9GAMM|nr:DUF3187 family protein [Shewanella marisflavi]ASJ97233.1 hypothetical protein CFF01_11905 [Shewanella marisflavi]